MSGAPRPATWLERAGVALLLAAALVPRVRDFSGPFDREFEGWQATFLTLGAINYERLGVGRFGGYPVVGVDLPEDVEAAGYLYPNHPAPVPLMTWLSIEAFGPEGWGEAWRDDLAPAGIEPAVRLPFLVFHLLGLLAFWWALRQASGPRTALLGLALLATTPISIVYATLANYENPSLPFVFLGYGFHVRFLRGGGARSLAAAGGAFALASSITFAPALFVPPLVLQTLARRRVRAAALEAAVLGACVVGPLLLHGLWVRAALPAAEAQSVFERARMLLGPLLDGSAPLGEWLRRQAVRATFFLSPALLGAAGAGLVLALARSFLPASRREGEVPLDLPLLLGGMGVLAAYYRHTFDGDGAHNGQTFFLLNVAPGAAALAATLLERLARPLARLRGGVGPLVVAVSLVALPGIVRANEIRRLWRAPGPRDDPPGAGPELPLPDTVGRELAAILPPGSIGLYPRGLGYNLAASYYAWRTLLPVTDETWGFQMTLIEDYGLAGRPRYMLLPVDPPAGMEGTVSSLRARLAADYERVDATERWELWPAFP